MEPDPDLDDVRDLASREPSVRRRALERLYERHRRRVYRVAYRVLGDDAAAQDVVQEVFLHLADRISTFRGDSALGSWLYRLTVNRAIDVRRREARRPAWRIGEEPREEGARRPSGGGDEEVPPSALDRAEDVRAVQAALARLSPKLRAILVLRYLEGLSYEDLGVVLRCSIGTVKSRLSRAHAAFEQALADAGVRSPAPPVGGFGAPPPAGE